MKLIIAKKMNIMMTMIMNKEMTMKIMRMMDLIIMHIMKYTISIIPLWNFDSATIELLSCKQLYEYIIYSDISESYIVNLKKQLLKILMGQYQKKIY